MDNPAPHHPHHRTKPPGTLPNIQRDYVEASAYSANTMSTQFDQWTISVTKGPILSSQCTCHTECRKDLPVGSSVNGNSLANDTTTVPQKCVFCRYDARIELKHLPDMVFVQNRLVISSPDDKFGVEFNAVDALNSIGAEPSDDIKVASAGAWQNARTESLQTYGPNAVKYDWTFGPNYTGTTFGITVEPTTDSLNMALLTQRDPVLFFDEFHLYCDELDDNGCAEMEVKIRVVESYLFVLLRYYLRVDHVAVKLQDVRLMFEKGKDFMLREYTLREAKTSSLAPDISPMEPVQIWSALKPTQTIVEKLSFRKV
ncbi:putative TIP41-like protein [Hypsibius exemplaris]|uniref:TIP41-like protein n=1 Tax=Hypsibius exemplaris TaxID=2072580 RepID=A0A1W0WVV4_HYPEX|nr:putative TIP41-like protein [Hypsibius exemplaris]